MKKSLGQHFLRSEKALNSIVQAGEVTNIDTVLEIGPGEGVLTKKLLDSGARVIAVEKDDDLYVFLRDYFNNEISSGQLILVHDDILEFDIKKIGNTKWKLIANIPYNITGAILRKFLSSDHQPNLAVLLVQKEVAERIVAKGDKDSILSISVKAYGDPRYVETVKAGSFAPAPKVDSAILAIDNISKEFFKSIREEDFFKMIREGFKSKRKKLSSNLSSLFPKDKIEKVFESLKLDKNVRAEDVDIHLWRHIGQKLL